jgi:hypothetical protein
VQFFYNYRIGQIFVEFLKGPGANFAPMQRLGSSRAKLSWLSANFFVGMKIRLKSWHLNRVTRLGAFLPLGDCLFKAVF